MNVIYVGLQPRHKERLYGTGVIFAGRGDVQEIEDEATARKMITRHPDQYADAEKHGPIDDGEGGEERATGDGDQGGEGGAGFAGAAIPQIEIDGEYKPVDKCTVPQLIDFAADAFGETLNKQDGKPAIVAKVIELMTAANDQQESEGQ